MESGILEDHILYSWILFYAFVVPAFLLALRLEGAAAPSGQAGAHEAYGSARVSASGEEEAASVAPSGTDENPTEGGGPKAKPSDRQRFRRRALGATALAVAGPAVYHALLALPTVDTRIVAVGPAEGDTAWQAAGSGAERPFAWQPVFQGADEVRFSAFLHPQGQVVVDHLIYETQRPRHELITGGNRIASHEALLGEGILLPVQTGGPPVTQAVVRTPTGPVLVWYWYRVGGMETAFAPRAKLLQMVAFFRRRPTAELIALSTSCAPQDCEGAVEVLRSFVGGP
jgi:EpsI family protein